LLARFIRFQTQCLKCSPQLIGVGPMRLESGAYREVMHIRLADKSERWNAKGVGLIKQVSRVVFMGNIYEATKEIKAFSAGS